MVSGEFISHSKYHVYVSLVVKQNFVFSLSFFECCVVPLWMKRFNFLTYFSYSIGKTSLSYHHFCGSVLRQLTVFYKTWYAHVIGDYLTFVGLDFLLSGIPTLRPHKLVDEYNTSIPNVGFRGTRSWTGFIFVRGRE